MRPLVYSMGLALALMAASSLPAQTLPPGGLGGAPYGEQPPPAWPDRPNYASPSTAHTPPGRVLQAAYQAEVAEAGPPPSTNPNADFTAGRPESPSPPGPGSALPLPPRGASSGSLPAGSAGGLPSAVTVVGSLAVVLGLFFVVAWAMRRATPGESALLPTEVVEVLGRKVLNQRQQLHMLRCGRKLLLVSVTPDGAETLTEITDPDEVDRLAGLCRQTQPGSATATFRHVLRQFSNEPMEGRDV